MAPVPTNTNRPDSADYPRELSSFLHSHPLALMIRNPLVPSRTHRICDLCRESIDGDFYRCKHCHFHVHSFCTRLPNSLRHVIDRTHKLTLHKLSSGCCSICRADCSSLWVYGCELCKVNVHLKCRRKPFGSREKTDRPSGSRGIHHHHAPAPPPWATGGHGQHHFHGGFPGGGGAGYGWGYPNYHSGHHGAVQFASNNHPSHHHNHGGHGPPSSNLGSVLGSAMFSLVQNLAIGALSDFIFGSIGF